MVMTTTLQTRQTHRIDHAIIAAPPLPREHGAWGILLIPFATAVGISGIIDLKIALLLLSVLSFYVARTSYLRGHAIWTSVLLAISVACVGPLLFVWKLWWLAAFGAVAALLAFRKTERSLMMQLLAVGGLTLTAPAARYTAIGHLDSRALLLWLLNAFYFAGGVFYVKMHVAAAMRRGDRKIRLGAPVLIYYTALSCVLLAMASRHLISFSVLTAYVTVVARALVGVMTLSPVLRIKRLGWTEVGHSLVYAVLLIVTMH